jgi:hypothetical protein
MIKIALKENESPLARLVLCMIFLSLAGSCIAAVHYYYVDRPAQVIASVTPVNYRVYDKIPCPNHNNCDPEGSCFFDSWPVYNNEWEWFVCMITGNYVKLDMSTWKCYNIYLGDQYYC